MGDKCKNCEANLGYDSDHELCCFLGYETEEQPCDLSNHEIIAELENIKKNLYPDFIK